MARCVGLDKLPRREWNKLFRTAVGAVLKDDGFKFPSVLATKAVQTAGQLLSWCSDAANSETMTSFVTELFRMFDRCILCSKRKLTHNKYVEKIWTTLHRERCSPEFRSSWSAFLSASLQCADDANPIFYQFVTDYMFKEVLKQKFPIREIATPGVQTHDPLTYEEKNCIRYIAGYILRALHKKIKRSAEPMKKEILLCLLDLFEGDDGLYDESCDWVTLRDRGGLNHVSNTMFLLLSAMEIEVKSHTSKQLDSFNLKGVLTEKLLTNEEVDFHWETLSVNWGDKESKKLLALIVDHWITIRGFAYTSNWMEKYKSITKKKVQKSKGIRKTLLEPKSSADLDSSTV